MASDTILHKDRWKHLMSTFKYNAAKKRYLEAIKHRQLFSGRLATREGIQKIINDIDNKVITTDKYAVLMKGRNGKRTLYQKRKSRFYEVLPNEDIFDITLRDHFRREHRDIDSTLNNLKKTYFLHLYCVKAALKSCTQCYPVDDPNAIITLKLPERKTWRMNISPYITNSSKDVLCYLLIYKENMSNFVVLRPLPSENEAMIITLFKIFLEFGSPQKVIVPDKLTFYRNLLQKMVTLRCPSDISVVLALGNEIVDDTSEVLTAINEWCKEMNSNHWDIGCHIVQLKMNTTKKNIIRIGSKDTFGVPYHLMFESNKLLPESDEEEEMETEES